MSFFGKWALVVLLATGDKVVLPLPHTVTNRDECRAAAVLAAPRLNEPVRAVACVERA